MGDRGRYRWSLAAAFAASACLLLPGAAMAKRRSQHRAKHQTESASQALGKSGAWSAYSFKDKTGRVCYLVGEPKKSEPAKAPRKPPMAMVTHRPDEKIFNVVSFIEGYPLKDGSDVTVDIDGKKYQLFTKGDSAWARTSDLDKTITEALGKGREAVVKGIARKGPDTIDTYSLIGFTKALDRINRACGVKR